jgi:hypothetical protein
MPASSITRAALMACALSCCLATQAIANQTFRAVYPEKLVGRVVANGQCVRFVQTVTSAPLTAEWRAGARVRGNRSIAAGTVIATFEADGTYTSRPGNHAAIYLSQTAEGIWVYDQWRGQPVHKRLIRFKAVRGSASDSKSNDGNLFRVVVSDPSVEVADSGQE